jgi:prolyl oligopeptidase
MRQGADGEDQILVDPAKSGADQYTAVRLVRVSPDGNMFLYETKLGGERTGTFQLFDVESRTCLPDRLLRGHLRAFAFAPDSSGFYYIHEPLEGPYRRAICFHALGQPFNEDKDIFSAGDDPALRIGFSSNRTHMFIFVHKFGERLRDVYLHSFGEKEPATPLALGMEHPLCFLATNGRFLAVTDQGAPNRKLVELRLGTDGRYRLVDVVPECEDSIQDWAMVGDLVALCYRRQMAHGLSFFDFSGRKVCEFSVRADQTIRLAFGSPDNPELLVETESFTEPVAVHRYSPARQELSLWAKRTSPLNCPEYSSHVVWYLSKDGTRVPMDLVGRHEVLHAGDHPTIMSAYGGYGLSITPQFSVLTAILMELGCLFALPHIRGGSELGPGWHAAAKRRNRQTAFDDFLSAADWLIESGRTNPRRLAIFGGSNGGLLMGAAITQRPALFTAVLCIAPILDMLRYHLFDPKHVSREEFGTSEDPDDFIALREYSPYHQVRDGENYPATMIVSGDADQTCNPLHARKMTARLQAANRSGEPIFLDYRTFRGHSPVLPLSERIDALTDRIAFFCDRLRLSIE